jgi:GNAT superfamily N-acetyltransferase
VIISSGQQLPLAEGLLFSEAGFDDGPALEELYAEAQAAIEELTGAPLLAADVQSLYISVPPGRSHNNKALLIARGADGETEIVALADVNRDHPLPGTWWIGFMMVRPRLQRRGVGRRVLAAVVDWAAAHEASGVALECPARAGPPPRVLRRRRLPLGQRDGRRLDHDPRRSGTRCLALGGKRARENAVPRSTQRGSCGRVRTSAELTRGHAPISRRRTTMGRARSRPRVGPPPRDRRAPSGRPAGGR